MLSLSCAVAFANHTGRFKLVSTTGRPAPVFQSRTSLRPLGTARCTTSTSRTSRSGSALHPLYVEGANRSCGQVPGKSSPFCTCLPSDYHFRAINGGQPISEEDDSEDFSEGEMGSEGEL